MNTSIAQLPLILHGERYLLWVTIYLVKSYLLQNTNNIYTRKSAQKKQLCKIIKKHKNKNQLADTLLKDSKGKCNL